MSATSSEHDLKYYFEAAYRNAEDYAEFMRTLEPGEESDIISSKKATTSTTLRCIETRSQRSADTITYPSGRFFRCYSDRKEYYETRP